MPVSPLGIEDFCFCNNEVSLQSVSGGAAPEGYLGRVRLKINDEFVSYVRESAQPAERASFERWLIGVHGYSPEDLIWQEKRNCYANRVIHLAWKAWQEAAQQADR